MARRPPASLRIVNVPARKIVEVDFVADNPGLTLLHCHMQEHMDFGFMNLVKYI
jgi:FtsP/CotA-like multicopper oxidase with cupredoxin domain